MAVTKQKNSGSKALSEPPVPPRRKSDIIIRGARVHNLKNVSLDLPRNALIVFTGVSGSGKSSLAFDTIYAEGQRRFVESLSSYARQFLERMDKPDVDLIQGISPAIAIEQRTTTRNPRSTVGTSTEIYDYLRLLFARIGKTICPNDGTLIRRDTVQTVRERLQAEAASGEPLRFYVLFPMQQHEGATLAEELENLKKRGFFRVVVRNLVIDLNEETVPPRTKKADVAVLVDRLIYRVGENSSRIADSIETAFAAGEGYAMLTFPDKGETVKFNQHFSCPVCATAFPDPDPRMFSFNNPFGACPKCQGFGRSMSIDMSLVIPDKDRTLREGAIHPWTQPKWKKYQDEMVAKGPGLGLRIDVPVKDLTRAETDILLRSTKGFDGVTRFFEMLEKKSYKIYYRVFLSHYRGYTTCDACAGSRLRPEALNIHVADKTLPDITRVTLEQVAQFFETIQLTEFEINIAKRILDELRRRLSYLVRVGIGYLTLDRLSSSLSGGESQRINLATALGSSLVGSLYVLDEPSIGLHPRDTEKLISIVKSLRDVGNTVVVVEHDVDMMRAADLVVDMGPNAGEMGGEVVFAGSVDRLKEHPESLTGQYLSGALTIPLPKKRRDKKLGQIVIRGAVENNLKSIDVTIPLRRFVCITGVSGSGKSTLIHDILYPGMRVLLNQESDKVGRHKDISGTEAIDAVEMIDQSPIGKTPRSNPATYVKAFDLIRELFSKTHAARVHGFQPGYFSFNVPGGRCETCEGSGVQTIEMQFLADLELTCEVCQGKRFKKEVLGITYHDKNIDDVLSMTVSDAIQFFLRHPSGKNVAKRLQYLEQVGMGYVRLGQSATTLSGGESQRVKLASHLIAHEDGKHTLFIFDEPTTGLHFDDIAKLLSSFNALIERGNSVVVIEHNMEVVKCADWIIDLGPEAGAGGGRIVAEGTPEDVAGVAESYTGKFLKEYLT